GGLVERNTALVPEGRAHGGRATEHGSGGAHAPKRLATGDPGHDVTSGYRSPTATRIAIRTFVARMAQPAGSPSSAAAVSLGSVGDASWQMSRASRHEASAPSQRRVSASRLAARSLQAR